MARLPRFVITGHPQHVIIRGNNREPIFYSDEDYRFYLDKLQDACIKHQCAIHAYVLMTNHGNKWGQTRLFLMGINRVRHDYF